MTTQHTPWVAYDSTLDSDPDGDYKETYWENCPFGCLDGDCEGHYSQRFWRVDGLFDIEKELESFMSEGNARLCAAAPALLAACKAAEFRILEVSVVNNVPGIQSQPVLLQLRAAIAAAEKEDA